jgi:hypothetical protein
VGLYYYSPRVPVPYYGNDSYRISTDLQQYTHVCTPGLMLGKVEAYGGRRLDRFDKSLNLRCEIAKWTRRLHTPAVSHSSAKDMLIAYIHLTSRRPTYVATRPTLVTY